jgi:protein phosphatase PTC7
MQPLKKRSRMMIWNSPASCVYVIGNFTEPQWGFEVLMLRAGRLDLFYTDFMYQQKLPPGNYAVKFKVNGQWTTSPLLPVKVDAQGNTNNLLKYSPLHKPLRSSGSVGALTAIELLDQFKKPFNIETESMPARSLTGSMDSPTSMYVDAGSHRLVDCRIVMKGFMAAHPVNKSDPLSCVGSADAYFIDKELQMFGMADGVGEWERHGLDPSLFPNELMSRSHQLAVEQRKDLSSLPAEQLSDALKGILDQAFRETQAWGSSTAMLALVKDSKLVLTSLGDSCVLVMRPSKFNRDKLVKIFKSKEQQHFFNCPYQLSHIPQPADFPALVTQGYGKLVNYLKQVLQSGPAQPPDTPYEHAMTTVLELHDGDVIVAATDGLFDNLFDSDIKKLGERELKLLNTDSEFCTRLAASLAANAVVKAFDTRYLSPFAKAAKKARNFFIGGKLDDVTVIVSRANGC